MSSESKTLHERVAACRRRLETEALADDVRRELSDVLTQLDERLLHDKPASKEEVVDRNVSVAELPLERLRDFERSIEVSHPVLFGLVRNLADSLSGLGI